MAVVAYIYLARSREQLVGYDDQHLALDACARRQGNLLDEVFIETDTPLGTPLADRPQGARMLAGLQPGDRILCLRLEWVLGTAMAATTLLERLREQTISLYCLDVASDLVLPEERKLAVSTGGAALVQQVVSALARCAVESAPADIRVAVEKVEVSAAESRDEVLQTAEAGKTAERFSGGPIPFGWEVEAASGVLVENAREQEVIVAMQSMRRQRLSYRAMARKLREDYEISLSSEGIRKILQRQAARQAE